MVEEIWRDVRGYEGLYQISNQGKLKSSMWQENYVSKGSFNVKGYLRTQLVKNGKKTNYYLHTLVAENFISPRPYNLEVGHLNGDKGDNRVENLKWVTQKENSRHRIQHGTHNRGEQNYSVKLTEKDVLLIRTLYKQKKFYQWELGEMFGIEQATISSIMLRKTWRHI